MFTLVFNTFGSGWLPESLWLDDGGGQFIYLVSSTGTSYIRCIYGSLSLSIL